MGLMMARRRQIAEKAATKAKEPVGPTEVVEQAIEPVAGEPEAQPTPLVYERPDHPAKLEKARDKERRKQAREERD